MADEERQDSNLWMFLLGFFLGVLIAGGGVSTYYFVQHQRLGREINEMRDRAEMAARQAMEAEAEARRAREQAEAERQKALEALAKLKKEK